ncbi:MAG TPA: NAD(P)/FAD-dependent oxidoreductase [Gemmataceae bacterium]|nr:NAD(P)/FAD-dependent oxidoreductase [Gemmataceae bacterium]
MTIAATLDLQEASRRTWDAAVVGAGPSGAMAARELARRGQDVLLIDRAAFPRWKVCGCCLNGHALATLREVGLGPMMARSGAVPLRGIRLAAAGRVAEISLSGGVSLSREAFDAALLRSAIEIGAAFLPQTWAALVKGSETSEVHWLELRQGPIREHVAARVVLAADGLGGKLVARAGGDEERAAPGARIGAGVVAATAPDFYAPGLIFMACGRDGYLGLVRLEDGRLNLAAALDPGWVRLCGGPGPAAEALLAEVGWPAVPSLAELSWRGTAALTRQPRHHAGERLFLIGDAAGYIEPFTGEGMAWALAAGRAVVPVAARSVQRWQPGLAREWDAIYHRLIAPRQFVCRAVAAVLRSPWLTRSVIRLLALAPGLARPMTRHLGCAANLEPGRRNPDPISIPPMQTTNTV